MISISKLNFGYKKSPELFSDFDLELSPGNIYGLLGRNGAGKTTLLKILSGLLSPQKGFCRVLDYSPMKRKPNFLNQVFYLPEEIYSPNIKIKKYVELTIPFYPKFDKIKFESYLKDLEINSEKKFTELSYGQKKRAYLAFGLASNCKLLLLDEPTNGLDIPTKSMFRKMLASSISDEKLILVSSHQVRDLQNIIDPIIILDEGEVILNMSLANITQRISIQLQQTKSNEEEVLYSEKSIGGYSVLTENNSYTEDDFNIELLFNAVLSKKRKLFELIMNEEVDETHK